MEEQVSLSDDVWKNIENDMVNMLDRLCVAYKLAQIRYDLEQPFHKLSFFGIALGKKLDVNFEEYYQSAQRTRSEADKKKREEHLLQVMRRFFTEYSRQIFREQWYHMADLLLYKKREHDALIYGKQRPNFFKDSFFDGKIVMNNADVKEVLALLNSAGFK
ncbi:unnamed protein product, partial [Cylicostephanus goldi]